jgi:hypothetical protein
MKYYRSLALAASLAAGLALPAFAQTASPGAAPAPAAGTSAPMPDAGVKKQAAAPVKHVHHVSRHKTAKPVTPSTKR